MEKLYKIREMVCDELDTIAKKGELSAGSLDVVDKLTHTLKSIETILAMNEAGYGDNGASYAGADSGNHGGNMSGARGRSRTTGRYVSREGNSWRRGYDRRGGMSYDGARAELVDHVEELMDLAKDEPTRQMIQRFKNELENA